MATPPTLPSLAAQLAALQTKVDELQARIADLEAFVASNSALIAGLSESDEASGWKQWRDNQNTEGNLR